MMTTVTRINYQSTPTNYLISVSFDILFSSSHVYIEWTRKKQKSTKIVCVKLNGFSKHLLVILEIWRQSRYEELSS